MSEHNPTIDLLRDMKERREKLKQKIADIIDDDFNPWGSSLPMAERILQEMEKE